MADLKNSPANGPEPKPILTAVSASVLKSEVKAIEQKFESDIQRNTGAATGLFECLGLIVKLCGDMEQVAERSPIPLPEAFKLFNNWSSICAPLFDMAQRELMLLWKGIAPEKLGPFNEIDKEVTKFLEHIGISIDAFSDRILSEARRSDRTLRFLGGDVAQGAELLAQLRSPALRKTALKPDKAIEFAETIEREFQAINPENFKPQVTQAFVHGSQLLRFLADGLQVAIDEGKRQQLFDENYKIGYEVFLLSVSGVLRDLKNDPRYQIVGDIFANLDRELSLLVATMERDPTDEELMRDILGE